MPLMKAWANAVLLLFFTACSFCAAASVAAPGKYGAGSIAEIGGSDYTFYDLGNATNGAPWDGSIRPVIGTYHLNPAAVETQLKQMYDSGQRKVSLVLWFAPFTTAPFPDAVPDMWAHIVDSSGGHLSIQHELNLRTILRWIKYIGFDGVTLRFLPQGSADPSSDNSPWNAGWSESQYMENFAFISSTRGIMESELAGSSIQRLYDLGEHAGITDFQAAPYTKRLWKDYTSNFGNADTYGFSVPIYPGRLTQQIAIYDQVGVRPMLYAIDAYGPPNPHSHPMDQTLAYVYDELLQAGENGKQVIIQETFADDANVAQRIVSALATVPLKIKYIVQWPVRSSAYTVHTAPPAEYKAYGGSSASSGTVVAHSCVLPVGQQLCTSKVNWASSYASGVKVLANGSLMATGAAGTAPASWIHGPNQFQLASDQGVLDGVGITALAVGTPVLDWLGAGLSCDGFQCVTVAGSNIENGCGVDIFASDWSAYLGPGDNVSCSPSAVTFAIPASVRQAHSGINFNVNNGPGKISEPIYVSIDPPAPILYKSGLGCSQSQCIWATGINITSGCTVALFAPDWSATLAVVSDVVCRKDGVVFEIPEWIRQQYSAVYFNVNNSYPKWSSPQYVQIH